MRQNAAPGYPARRFRYWGGHTRSYFDAQFDLLREEGCTQAQGYLFSPPRPAAEVETMLRKARAAQAVA